MVALETPIDGCRVSAQDVDKPTGWPPQGTYHTDSRSPGGLRPVSDFLWVGLICGLFRVVISRVCGDSQGRSDTARKEQR